MRDKIRYLVVATCVIYSGMASATDIVQDCLACDDANDASVVGELFGYGLPDGNHTVFIVNMNIPTLWQVDLNVDVTDPDPWIGLGSTIVTVVSVTPAVPQVNDALQGWKNLGITSVTQSGEVDFFIDLSDDVNVQAECPGAPAGACASISARLQAQSETTEFVESMESLDYWLSRFADALGLSDWVPLRFLVLFPDGSFEIFEFKSLGAFEAVPDTAGDANGNPTNGGGGGSANFDGWWSYYEGESGTTYTPYASPGGGGGSNCTVGVAATVDQDGNVVSITTTTYCE